MTLEFLVLWNISVCAVYCFSDCNNCKDFCSIVYLVLESEKWVAKL